MAELAQTLTFHGKDRRDEWPAQGEWTYEDYLRLPEDGRRYEVIRGHLYVTAAPIYAHQYVVSRLFMTVGRAIDDADLGVLLGAPFDVLLPRGIAAPIQPDLIFFQKGHEPQWGAKNFAGVPDLVIEVLSRGTRKRDRTTKLDAYRDAGVPEYWLVDPEERTVVVYALSEDRRRYVESLRCGIGGTVTSMVLPGLELPVAALFPRG